jgi:hypothetical protein
MKAPGPNITQFGSLGYSFRNVYIYFASEGKDKTNCSIQWSRALLEKPTVAYPLKKLSALYGD